MEGHAWRRMAGFGIVAFAATAACNRHLLALVRHALDHDLHSHILLIPFVAGWVLWQRRDRLPAPGPPALFFAALFAALGGASLVWLYGSPSAQLSLNDRLALSTASWLCLLLAGAFLFLGRNWVRAAAAGILVLVFLVPLPDRAVLELEEFLVDRSADATAALFDLSGTTHFRDGRHFQIPGISLHVARECSGIRSTWVLLITSWIAATVLLEAPWRRAVLLFLVIPLGVLRNAIRIFVIAQLCIRFGPHMIESAVHKHGGPFFFAVSLLPLFLALWLLRRGEVRKRRRDFGIGNDATPAPARS